MEKEKECTMDETTQKAGETSQPDTKGAAEDQCTEAAADAASDEALEEAVKKAEQAGDAIKDQLMRLQADFENYKKRTAREKGEIAQYTMEGLMTKLLPVIDNLERAEAAADDSDAGSYRDGVQMVFKELMNVLNSEGLKEIEAQGQPFDPNFHHGVAVGSEDDKPDQEVLEVFQKGYLFKDKVIRAAMVKINQK